jgi:hypothetical protein
MAEDVQGNLPRRECVSIFFPDEEGFTLELHINLTQRVYGH